MIAGENSRANDLDREHHEGEEADEHARVHRRRGRSGWCRRGLLGLEQAIEWINDDELVEITPDEPAPPEEGPPSQHAAQAGRIGVGAWCAVPGAWCAAKACRRPTVRGIRRQPGFVTLGFDSRLRRRRGWHAALRGLLERVGEGDEPRLAARPPRERHAVRRGPGAERVGQGGVGALGTVPNGTMTLG